ncbi:Protein YLS3, partial [Mucuna pruriens]
MATGSRTVMNEATWMFVVVVVVVLVSAAAEEEEGCTEELISFSACLPYVSYPPNNLTESASDKCCKAFSSAVESVCLCYLLREPLILGFPLNSTRILSLSSICPSSPTSTSFPFLCSVSPSLPPLNSAPTQTAARSRGKGESSGRKVPKATSGAGSTPDKCDRRQLT